MFDGITWASQHEHDHQRPGRDSAGVLHLRGAVRGRGARSNSAGTLQNDILKEFHAQNEFRVSAPARVLSWSSTRSNTARSTCRSGNTVSISVITSARPAPPSAGAGVHDRRRMCYTEECDQARFGRRRVRRRG